MKKIKSTYLLKEEILDYLPVKRTFQILFKSKEYLKLLQINPCLYQLFSHMNEYFEPYQDNLEIDMLSYISHFSRIYEQLPIESLKYFFFRFLREQSKIFIEYNNSVYFGDFLKFISNGIFKGTLVIKIMDEKYDLKKCPNIDIKNSLINLEFVFDIDIMDNENPENLEYVKTFLNDKIIGINNKNYVKKIKFIEPIDLSDEKPKEFYEFLLQTFPNCMINIKSSFSNDINSLKNIDRFYQIKLLLEDKNSGGGRGQNFKFNQINDFLTSIHDLNELFIDYCKNKITSTDNYFKEFKNSKKLNKPTKLTLANFEYLNNKSYFDELNNHIKELSLVQRQIKNDPYPIKISERLSSLLVLKLEKVNILESNLVNVINNNKSLEVFEFDKKFSQHVYGEKLSTALSQLRNLKVLSTQFFWYKKNLNNYELFKDGHIIENEFFKHLKSESLYSLLISFESNVNIQTLNENLPNLFKLTIESSNLVTYSQENEDDKDDNKNNNKSIRDYKGRRQIKNFRENKIICHDEEKRLFLRLNELNLRRVENCNSFCQKMSSFNRIGILSIVTYMNTLFDKFNKYCSSLTNLEHLGIVPDYTEKIDDKEFEVLVKNIHYFKKLVSLEVGFFDMNQNLIDLLFNEIKNLSNLKQLKITIKTDSTSKILENKFNVLKSTKNLSITYIYRNRKSPMKLLLEKLKGH